MALHKPIRYDTIRYFVTFDTIRYNTRFVTAPASRYDTIRYHAHVLPIRYDTIWQHKPPRCFPMPMLPDADVSRYQEVSVADVFRYLPMPMSPDILIDFQRKPVLSELGVGDGRRPVGGYQRLVGGRQLTGRLTMAVARWLAAVSDWLSAGRRRWAVGGCRCPEARVWLSSALSITSFCF